MNDETINRILDMIEKSGAVVLPIVIIGAVISVVIFGVTFWFIIRVMKSIFKDLEDSEE